MRTLAALRSIVTVLLVVAGFGAAGPVGRVSASDGPPKVLASELTPQHDGKSVTMTFEVAETYAISGSVPVGGVPSFGLRPVLKEGSAPLSVLVSGELADIMRRFNMGPGPGGTANGRMIEASGVVTAFQPLKDAADQRVSYQLHIADWKTFRLMPPVTAR
jgi:hypothetical protein